MPTLMLVPTGIGCAIGGYAGDALPSARLLAAASGCLITHPNVLNGASLYWSDPRIHYVEGYGLDRFAAGEWLLRPVRRQRIGLLLDAGIEPELAQRQIQVAEACRATLGLEIGPVLSTDVPLGVHLEQGASGASWGSLERPDALLRAGERLQNSGATAIAVVARFPEDPQSAELAAYRQGSGVDALAGAEAVIRHLLVRHLQIPCAHAPALGPLPLDPHLDPRAAAEVHVSGLCAGGPEPGAGSGDGSGKGGGRLPAGRSGGCRSTGGGGGAGRGARRRGAAGRCGAERSGDRGGQSLGAGGDPSGAGAGGGCAAGRQLLRGGRIGAGPARGAGPGVAAAAAAPAALMPGGFANATASDQQPCPCGGGSYGRCCAPMHRGERQAPTAEQLMRSRYSAFVRGEVDYLLATHPEPGLPVARRRREL